MENFNSLNRFLNSKENLNSKSLSKKFLFSLAAVSVLATCANAQISGAGCSGTCGTVSDTQTGKITVSGTGNTSLTITNSGSVNVSNNIAIDFQKDSSIQTFKNQGTVIGGSNKGSIVIGDSNGNGATITTFENSGVIGNGTSKFGVVIWAKDDNTNSTITNFNNSGAISSNTGESIFIKNTTINNFTNSGTISSSQQQGINISSGVTISTFKNSGTIGNGISRFGITVSGSESKKSTITNFNNSGIINSSTGESVFTKNTTITTFENSGTIKSNSTYGINISDGSTIDKFTNKGIIISYGNNEPTDNSTTYTSSGMRLQRAHIKTFENTGTILGKNGLTVTASTIDKFENTGLIESTSEHKLGAAVDITNLTGDVTTIKNFTNSGTIKADNASGILIEAGNKIETLNNKGTIEAGLYGISFFTVDQHGKEINLGQINLEEGSVIKAGQDGIHIDGSDRGIKAKGIEVKQ
ncbi:hypothetical protein H2277_08065, partial [Campylobacter sp. W0014]|nr:hypothetical protein [Campylobacter sp. W0014]